LGFSEAVHCL